MAPNVAANQGDFYRIQAGDTFWKLAQQWGKTVQAIQDANPDQDPNKLQVGQLIKRPGTGSQGPNSAGIDVNTLLNHINKYRASHQAGAASWDAGLASQAQQWVDHLAATGKFEHGGAGGAGQNLAGASGDEDATKACIAATDRWYSEVKNYDWNNPVFSQNTGHFTQVVWKGSTRVGYAMAKRPSGGYVIAAHYVVPGNLGGAFRDNVLPRVS